MNVGTVHQGDSPGPKGDHLIMEVMYEKKASQITNLLAAKHGMVAVGLWITVTHRQVGVLPACV